MSVVLVRNTTTYEAIHANDPDADAVLRRWFEDANPGEDSSDVSVPDNAKEQSVWFLRAKEGELAIIHPAVFAADFETIGGIDDSMAQFEAMLKQTAKVEEAVNVEGLTPQQVIDNYIGEKIALMLNEFDALESEQDDKDSEDNTFEEGVSWSKKAFLRVFGVREN